jgi:hypothetical protein
VPRGEEPPPANQETNDNPTSTDSGHARQGELVDPDVTVTRTEVALFVNEGETATAEHVRPSTEPSQLEAAATDVLTNDVIGFLQRPVQWVTVDWLATSPAGSRLNIVKLPYNWMLIPMIQEKLRGFRYLKADFRIKVQVNAQPFNAGMLLIVFNPLRDQLTIAPSSVKHIGGLTGYRHVVLDLATSTEAEILVPFPHLLSHIDMSRGIGALGNVEIYVYSPLTGLTDVDFTVWVQAENISIQIPTPIFKAPPPSLFSQQDYTEYRGVAQVNLSAEKKRPGNVETIARTAGTVAKMASMIPGIGGVATAAGAVTDAVAGLASMFGWSKPTDPEFPTKVEVGYGRYTANANGDSKVKGLGFDARTAVTLPTSLANDSEDEMAIAAILSRPVFFARFGFDKTQTPGTLLSKFPVCPTACTKANFTGTGAVGTTYFNTFLSYLAPLFVCYRGALKYTFRLVKTPFHSGRIMITFVPGAEMGTTFANIDLLKCYRQIYDLRRTSKIEFEVPFIHNAPFKSIRAKPNTLNPTALAYTIPTGVVYVSVVNALRNPATTSDSIDIIVEVSAGSDFQFAGPVLAVGADSTGNISVVRGDEVTEPLIYSGEAQSNDLAPLASTTLFTMNEHGIGEVVESLRTLLKRYTEFDSTYTNPIQPYDPTWWGVTPSQAALVNQKVDVFTYISQLYRFKAGGMRVATVMKDVTANKGFRYAINPIGLGSLHADGIGKGLQRGNIYQFAIVEPFMEIGVPFYQRTPAILTDVGLPTDTSADDTGNYTSMPSNDGTQVTVYPMGDDALIPTDDISTTFRLLRSVGEDFSFFYLLGPPITGIYTTPPPP